MSRSASNSTNKKTCDRHKTAPTTKQQQQPLKTKPKNEASDPLEPSSNDEDDEPLRAPVQLKIEFINSIMFRQWPLAKKLCQFMLMYEPNNSEAKQFAPLIDYMLNKEESSSSSSDDTSDDDDDDGDSSDTSSSSDSSNENENGQDEEKENRFKETSTTSFKSINGSASRRCINQK